jgi:two-component system, chemotaxis family, chemotaxis protein CheY
MSASAFVSEPSSVSACSKRFLRILYADDVRELRELARLSFSRDGHGIECVIDGLAALNRIKADASFDLVITDHHMPNMNGLELVRELRDVGYRGKIMVFSSELNPDVAVEYQKFGIDRILYKPVYPSALRFVLAEIFGLPLEPAHT